ncbi:hypothetical protein OGM63_06525 [Plectonema radiosum NIES-515]|uniref:Uncharacterized protein n=2 Tax=Plectonema TaxID=1183 RepID=A0ABT3AWU0_9CYAN|nr:hypothetical protein [Plectonema radiosum NIES-515]
MWKCRNVSTCGNAGTSLHVEMPERLYIWKWWNVSTSGNGGTSLHLEMGE